MVKRILPFFLIFTLLFIVIGCGGEKSSLDTANETYDKLSELYNNSDTSPEEKAKQAQSIMDEIAPTLSDLEKQKDDELPKMGRTFQIWQSYVSMNGACNAIVQNDDEYAQKCLSAAKESLERAEKETD